MMVYTVLKMMQRVDGEEVDIDEYIDSKDLQERKQTVYIGKKDTALHSALYEVHERPAAVKNLSLLFIQFKLVEIISTKLQLDSSISDVNPESSGYSYVHSAIEQTICSWSV